MGDDDPELLGRDPNLIKCSDNYQDDIDCRNTKNILQMFKKMEMGEDEEEEDGEYIRFCIFSYSINGWGKGATKL